MRIAGVAPDGTAPAQVPKHGARRAAGLIIGALVLLAAFVVGAPYISAALKQGSSILTGTTTTPSTTSTSTGPQSTASTEAQCASAIAVGNLAKPDIAGSSANVAYPSDYCTLAAYALDLINHDRATNGSAPVSLDYNRAAQQHADSMLYYGYFSHWDTQGYKPYMRYSLLGGTGGDAENIAWRLDSRSPFSTTSGVESAINQSEFGMMYHDNDSLGCFCNNGHRYNILNALHTFVSIGIAYNGTSVYFDEEFESSYFNISFSVTPASSSSPYYVTMSGPSLGGSIPSCNPGCSVFIAYDPTPGAESAATLNNGPHEYDPGTLIGGVLQCSTVDQGLGNCPKFTSGVTAYAATWSLGPSGVNIAFSLKGFVDAEQQQNNSGPGVYTIYLVTGSSTTDAITSISVFVS